MTITRALYGLEPDKFSRNVLNINPGHAFDFYGKTLYDFPRECQVDLDRQGLWGFDSGTPSDGDGIYLYLVADAASGDYGLIATKSIFQGGVVCPSGYSVQRKLPWGVIYRNAWDGIPNFHLTHWPMPAIRFTDAEYAAPWMPLGGVSTANWTDIDLSGYIPDNARLADIAAEVRYNGGRAGSAYLRSHGAQSTGLLVGSGSPTCALPGMKQMSIRVDSKRHIQYRTTGDALLYLMVLGYSMTEPA